MLATPAPPENSEVRVIAKAPALLSRISPENSGGIVQCPFASFLYVFLPWLFLLDVLGSLIFLEVLIT